MNEFVKDHPGQIKNMVGRTTGAAVMEFCMKNNYELERKSRLYERPSEDVLGKEEWKDRVKTFNSVQNAEYKGRLGKCQRRSG